MRLRFALVAMLDCAAPESAPTASVAPTAPPPASASVSAAPSATVARRSAEWAASMDYDCGPNAERGVENGTCFYKEAGECPTSHRAVEFDEQLTTRQVEALRRAVCCYGRPSPCKPLRHNDEGLRPR